MIIYTDSLEYAERAMPGTPNWSPCAKQYDDPGLNTLASKVYSTDSVLHAATVADDFWRYLFIVERASMSHYDIVIDLLRQNTNLPDRLLCLAGSGDLLHGQRNRPWLAMPGNIHLTAHLTPQMRTNCIGHGFSVLAAVSVIETIDKIDGLTDRAGIKWVNDIVIDDAKVAGFITHTLNIEDMIGSAIIGIGLNVETTPPITPDRFFYRGASLCDFTPAEAPCEMETVLSSLLDSLAFNYEQLRAGERSQLMDIYRQRSIIIGREVEIVPDSPHRAEESPIRGIVTEIGDNLELVLKGRKSPITRGRLTLL